MDALTLAVIQAGLQQVCNEMDIAFSRAAFSPVIAEADDRSDGIYAAADGALIAQGELGLPVFVGTMAHSAAHLVRLIGEGAVAAAGARRHLHRQRSLSRRHAPHGCALLPCPSSSMGELFCWLQNTGHWPDIGGMVPGGFSAHATEVEQEGLRLPPVKLFKRGVLDREILSIIQSNIRVADQRIGDIKAQAAALLVGEQRLSGNGRPPRPGHAARPPSPASATARRIACAPKSAASPKAVYTAEAFVDSDGVVNEALRIALTVTRQGDELVFDLSRSSPPCLGPMNSVWATTCSADLSRDEAHLPRCADQCRHLRADPRIAAGGHLPRCPLSPPGLRLRGGSVAAHRGGGVPGAGAGACRRISGPHPPAPPAISRLAASIPRGTRAM